MTNQITEIEQAIAKEITINPDGHGFITGRGLARLLGVNQSTISRASVEARDAQGGGKIAEILAGLGFGGDALAQGYPDVALVAIAAYYGYESKAKSEQAKRVLMTMSAIGARTWMQKVKGWTKAPVVAQPALPPADVRVANLVGALKDIGFELDNPRFNQQLKDWTGDIMGWTPDQHALPGDTDRWAGVVEIAEEMGYPVAQVLVKRSSLGKWVSRHYKGDRRQEKRLCNGTQRLIWLYRVTPELEAVISNYPQW